MFLQSVECCGSVLEDGTRRPAPGKMAALQLWKRPETITQLRASLGCCIYYHKFLWHDFLSKFDLNVTYIPGRYNTLADTLSRWAYPASEAYSEVSFHGTSKEKAEVIEFDKAEQALIKKHCLPCSIKNRMTVEVVRCKEITKADQTERINSDSESSLALLNVFPLTRSKAKSKLPP